MLEEKWDVTQMSLRVKFQFPSSFWHLRHFNNKNYMFVSSKGGLKGIINPIKDYIYMHDEFLNRQ